MPFANEVIIVGFDCDGNTVYVQKPDCAKVPWSEAWDYEGVENYNIHAEVIADGAKYCWHHKCKTYCE